MEWRELITRCADGNKTAFDEFVKKYYDLLLFLVRQKTRNQNDHEDILQEVFLKMHRLNLFARFRGESEAEFKAYLARICLNTLYTHLNRESAAEDKVIFVSPEDLETIWQGEARDSGPLPQLLQKELMEQLETAVAGLPEQYRDIINLRLLGYTHQDISNMLKKPKGTVDSYSARAYEILRDKLRNFASEFSKQRT